MVKFGQVFAHYRSRKAKNEVSGRSISLGRVAMRRQRETPEISQTMEGRARPGFRLLLFRERTSDTSKTTRPVDSKTRMKPTHLSHR